MDEAAHLPTPELVAALKAAAEPTRLRILLLLQTGELNVKDLTLILGQSQPRISRHLKLLVEAGLVDRFRDGSWVYFHISDRSSGGRLARRLVSYVDPLDANTRRDRERSETLKHDRQQAAQKFFVDHASDWDRIRSLHVSESDVEAAMLDALDAGPFSFLVDLGTGTGRALELFAERYGRGLGIDVNQAMLSYASARLEKMGNDKAQVRHGDIYALSLPDKSADAIVMHQVLHFLSDPALAVREAARVLKPGGKLLIVDFAPHALDFLREEEAHERLGFARSLVTQWMEDAGLVARSYQQLAPSDAEASKKLTVSIWLGECPADAIDRRHKNGAQRSAARLEGAR